MSLAQNWDDAGLLFILMMVGMFIPFQAVIIPLFVFLKALALQGTLIGIVIVHIIYGLPFATLIMRNYYETIPDAIVEAASVDGCGLLRTFFQVMLPLSIPGFVVAGIFQFTNIWNDFLFGGQFRATADPPSPGGGPAALQVALAAEQSVAEGRTVQISELH